MAVDLKQRASQRGRFRYGRDRRKNVDRIVRLDVSNGERKDGREKEKEWGSGKDNDLSR